MRKYKTYAKPPITSRKKTCATSPCSSIRSRIRATLSFKSLTGAERGARIDICDGGDDGCCSRSSSQNDRGESCRDHRKIDGAGDDGRGCDCYGEGCGGIGGAREGGKDGGLVLGTLSVVGGDGFFDLRGGLGCNGLGDCAC